MKKYPLTAAQRLHFYTLKYCPQKQVLNIGTSLTINIDINWSNLKVAIYKAYERCESMRIRFTEGENGEVEQYIVEKEERDIEYFDFTGWSMKDAENKMREWTETPFDRDNAPLNRIVMITMPDNYKGLYMLVDHMTMDAQSLIVFLKDVIELYCNLEYEGVPYPKEMTSYIAQLEKDLAYENGSKALEKDKSFFKKYIESSEPIFCDIDGVERLQEERIKNNNPNQRALMNTSNNTEANISVLHLEEEPSNRLMDFCHNTNISMVCLLIMGIRTYFQKFNKIDDVSIMTTIARRATISEKHCGGTRIHCFPCRTIVDENKTFMEGIDDIKEVQNSLFRHANYDPTAVFAERRAFYEMKSGETYEPMSLTYQPLTMKNSTTSPDESVDLSGIDYKTNWYSNGVCAHALYLTVMHRSNDNGLDFNFEHQTGKLNQEKLEYFYYYLCKILFVGIENPNMTIGEIIERV